MIFGSPVPNSLLSPSARSWAARASSVQGTVARGKGWAISCHSASGGPQGLSDTSQCLSSMKSWGRFSENAQRPRYLKWVSPETRCWWHRAGVHPNTLPAGFVDVAKMRTCDMLNNSRIEKFIPGYSHRVTPPQDVFMYVMRLQLL